MLIMFIKIRPKAAYNDDVASVVAATGFITEEEQFTKWPCHSGYI